MITVITCETGCGQTIAAFHDADEAHEVAAYETGHYCSEAGYSCTACYEDYWNEAMRDAWHYNKEQEYKAYVQESQDAIDAMLDAADLARDIARGR